jgi:hypothetical protein
VPSGSQEDYQLGRFLAEAESAIEEALLPVAYAAYGATAAQDVPVRGGPWLPMPAYQAGSITAVALVGWKGTASETATALTDYAVVEGGRALYRDAGWPLGTFARITAIWGYGPAPAAAQRIAYELAVNFWRGRDQGMYSAVQGAEDGGKVVYTGGLNASHRRIIETIQRSYRWGVAI